MIRAAPGDAAGKYLCALRNKSAKLRDIFIINVVNFIDAERANLFATFSVSSVASFVSVASIASIITVISIHYKSLLFLKVNL
jgi:hypothetical protein